MTHYNIPKSLKTAAESHKLTGPCFIGQGCSYGVGSDCYGFYVTDLKTLGNGRIVAGLVPAHSEMAGAWEEGTMICTMPKDKTPTEWVTKFRGKWWFCSKDGDRYLGDKCRYRWNGAFAYRDPHF